MESHNYAINERSIPFQRLEVYIFKRKCWQYSCLMCVVFFLNNTVKICCVIFWSVTLGVKWNISINGGKGHSLLHVWIIAKKTVSSRTLLDWLWLQFRRQGTWINVEPKYYTC